MRFAARRRASLRRQSPKRSGAVRGRREERERERDEKAREGRGGRGEGKGETAAAEARNTQACPVSPTTTPSPLSHTHTLSLSPHTQLWAPTRRPAAYRAAAASSRPVERACRPLPPPPAPDLRDQWAVCARARERERGKRVSPEVEREKGTRAGARGPPPTAATTNATPRFGGMMCVWVWVSRARTAELSETITPWTSCVAHASLGRIGKGGLWATCQICRKETPRARGGQGG